MQSIERRPSHHLSHFTARRRATTRALRFTAVWPGSTLIGRLGLAALLLALAALLLAARPASADDTTITMRLDSVSASGVSGTATLVSEGNATRITLDIAGLPPGATARATLHSGTCAAPSASAAPLPAPTADGAGHATAGGLVRFRDEDLALWDLVDGEHVIAISLEGAGVLACGAVRSSDVAAPPATSPSASLGAWASLPWAGILGALGLAAIIVGLFLLRRRNPSTTL